MCSFCSWGLRECEGLFLRMVFGFSPEILQPTLRHMPENENIWGFGEEKALFKSVPKQSLCFFLFILFLKFWSKTLASGPTPTWTHSAGATVRLSAAAGCRRTGAWNSMSPFPPLLLPDPPPPHCPPPCCHLSSWQHPVMASRCNQDDMLVLHLSWTGWHTGKNLRTDGDKVLLNINQLPLDYWLAMYLR